MSVATKLVPTLAAAAAIALAVSLGNWQVRRAAEKLDMQRQQQAAESAQPVVLPGAPLAEADAAALAGRRVLVRGRLLPELGVYVDNRSHEGIAGFHLVTPLRIAGAGDEGVSGSSARHVLVLRGWLPRDPRDRTRLPAPPAPAGTVELVGWAESELPQALELKHRGPPEPGQRIWQNLTRDEYARWSGLALQPLVIRQTEAARVPGPKGGETVDDGLVRDWRRPGPDVDKHRGYAFQWYALAAATAALWVWFVVIAPLKTRQAARGARNRGTDSE